MTSDELNPYQSPLAPTPLPQPPGELFAPCPKCGGRTAKRINFTFWGGAIGPRLFNHVKCLSCGATYNGKTGRSNATAIAIYTIVGALIGIVVVVALGSIR